MKNLFFCLALILSATASRAFLVCVLIFGLGLPVFANECTTGSLASILGTTCSIADKTFTFTDYVPEGYDWVSHSYVTVDPNNILFNVDTSDPLALSFTLSSDEFQVLSHDNPNGNNEETGGYLAGTLDFTITRPEDSLYISYTQVTLNGTSVNSGPGDQYVTPDAFVAGNIDLTGVDCVTSQSIGSLVGTLNQTCGDIAFTSQSGSAFWDVSAGGGDAAASMSSVKYTFFESNVRPVPEPASIWMFLVGGAAFMGRRVFYLLKPRKLIGG